MKKTMLMFLSLGMIVLLGLVVYLVFFLPGSNTMHPVDQRDRMGPSMMHRTGSFVNNEYEFLAHMIPHHEEAIFTANILKENTESEEMIQFAERIIISQSEEIEKMKTWLTTWYPDKDHQIDYQPMMRDLEGLKGEELDIAFLEDMIPHHMEAIMMSQQLLSRGLAEHEEIAELARAIRNDQLDEIHMMRNMLNTKGGES